MNGILRTTSHLFREARRRKVFRTAGLYVVGAWLALQAAALMFPGFGIPEAAIRALIWAAVAGLPLAVVFGWLFEVGPGGIRRTAPAELDAASAPQPLAGRDYLLLAAFAAAAVALAYRAAHEVRETPREDARAEGFRSASDVDERLENSIAVLAFANMSDDPGNEYFADGVAEEILDRLGRSAELKVIGRTSSFAFKGSDFGIEKISGLLGVRYVLQGSVRKAGSELRVSAQLLDAAGVQVWSDTFDRRLENVFEIQSEIAAAVAAAVASVVLPEPEAAAHQPDLVAYDHYLKGRDLLHQRNARPARAELGKAVEIDPQFAEAHAELALAYFLSADDPETLRLARASLDRATELRPRLLRARAIEGLALGNAVPPDAAGSERVLREVLDQDPNMSDALNWLQNALLTQGRQAEARAILERAWRVDPLHAAIAANYAGVLRDEGRIDEAHAIARRLLAQPAPGPLAYEAAIEGFEATGDLVGMHEAARAIARNWAPPRGYFALAESYAKLGDWASVDAWLDRQEKRMPDSPYMTGQRVLQQVWQGHYEEAVQLGRERLAAGNQTYADLPEAILHGTGFHLARAGEYAQAIELLEPLYDLDKPETLRAYSPEPSFGPHGLAWAYLRTGARDRADRLLGALARDCAGVNAAGRGRDAASLFLCAQTEVLRGDHDRALDLLEQAIEAGWRSYYIRQRDPFWAVLAEHPRYRALMARVKADVGRMRVEIQRMDAREDLGAIADADIAAEAAQGP